MAESPTISVSNGAALAVFAIDSSPAGSGLRPAAESPPITWKNQARQAETLEDLVLARCGLFVSTARARPCDCSSSSASVMPAYGFV